MKPIKTNPSLIFLFLLFSIFGLGNSYIYYPQDWLNLPSVETIHSITADPFNVYIGTPDAIYIFEKLANQVTRTLTSSDGITGVIRICAFDRQSDLLWIVAENQLIGYNPRTNFIITLYPNFYIRSLGVVNSYLYFLTDDKPQRMQKTNHTFKVVDKTDTNAIWYGERKSYQVTDYPFLVPYFYFDENLVRHNITVVFEDRKTLWVGADEYGLLTYDLVTKQPLSHWRLGPDIGTIYRIIKLDNEIWFVGNDGYAKYFSQTGNWDYYQTLFGVIFSSKSILLQFKILDLKRAQGISSLVQEQNNYWIGSQNQLFVYEAKTNFLTPVVTFLSQVNNISANGDTILIATTDGLYLYREKTEKLDTVFDIYNKLGFGVFDIYRAKSFYYFSVYGGFLSLDTLDTWQLHIPPGIDLSLPFTSLAGFGDYLFLGTDNGVIAYNEKTERYDYFTTKEGLLSNYINALYADSSFLWIANNRGITRLAYRRVLP
jgi:ligand-binding sensor domain-containing protein